MSGQAVGRCTCFGEPLNRFQHVGTGEDRLIAQFFIDGEKLVVLRDAIGSGHRSGFDLADSQNKRDGPRVDVA